jgi:uncharacterized protein
MRKIFAAGCVVSLLFGVAVYADAPIAKLDIITATGAHHYEVEIANNEPTREHGLMDRHEMAANHGMLFEFPERAPVTFWMKDTYIPLDMIFIDTDGAVRAVFENAKPQSESLIPSGVAVVGVLELNGGQAKAIKLKVGDKVKAAFFAH